MNIKEEYSFALNVFGWFGISGSHNSGYEDFHVQKDHVLQYEDIC